MFLCDVCSNYKYILYTFLGMQGIDYNQLTEAQSSITPLGVLAHTSTRSRPQCVIGLEKDNSHLQHQSGGRNIIIFVNGSNVTGRNEPLHETFTTTALQGKGHAAALTSKLRRIVTSEDIVPHGSPVVGGGLSRSLALPDTKNCIKSAGALEANDEFLSQNVAMSVSVETSDEDGVPNTSHQTYREMSDTQVDMIHRIIVNIFFCVAKKLCRCFAVICSCLLSLCINQLF